MNYAEIIEQVMNEAGFSKRYRGYRCLSRCILFALRDSSLMEYIVKGIYMPVAKELNYSYACVERNIRSIRDVYWDKSLKAYMESITDIKYDKKPCISEIITVLSLRAECMARTNYSEQLT